MDKAPMNCLENNDGAWESGHKTLFLLRSTVEQCFEQEKLDDQQINVLVMSIWSYVHGLTSLGIRDRFCVMQVTEQELEIMIKNSLEMMINKFLPI